MNRISQFDPNFEDREICETLVLTSAHARMMDRAFRRAAESFNAFHDALHALPGGAPELIDDEPAP